MITLKVICDRCKQEVKDALLPTAEYPCSGGFYMTEPPGYWSQFANPGEKHVCDPCMFADPRYIKVYGAMK